MACVIRKFQSVCKTNNLIGQTSKAHQSKQSDWSNCTHCAPRLGEIEINFRFRAAKLPFLKCWPCLVSLYLDGTRARALTLLRSQNDGAARDFLFTSHFIPRVRASHDQTNSLSLSSPEKVNIREIKASKMKLQN